MFARFALAVSLYWASLLPIVAEGQGQAPCPVLGNAVTAVRPHELVRRIGNLTMARVDGASPSVPVEPGPSAEWLQCAIEQHTAAMASAAMQDCPLAHGKLPVSVGSGGNGCWVAVRTDDREPAWAVLSERATPLAPGGT